MPKIPEWRPIDHNDLRFICLRLCDQNPMQAENMAVDFERRMLWLRKNQREVYDELIANDLKFNMWVDVIRKVVQLTEGM